MSVCLFLWSSSSSSCLRGRGRWWPCGAAASCRLSAATTSRSTWGRSPPPTSRCCARRPALWGYSMQATNEAMSQIAESIRERDVRIVALEQLVTDLSRDHAPAPRWAAPTSAPGTAGSRPRRDPVGPYGPPAAFDPAESSFAAADDLPPRPAPRPGRCRGPGHARPRPAAPADSAGPPLRPPGRAGAGPAPGGRGRARRRTHDPWAAAAARPERRPWETVAEQEPARGSLGSRGNARPRSRSGWTSTPAGRRRAVRTAPERSHD